MKKEVHILIFIIAVFCSSCATIIHGERQAVAIKSKPPGATIMLNDSVYGVTPKVINMQRDKPSRRIKLTLDGYETYTAYTTRSVDGWFFVNILIGGLIGMGIDAATGSMYSISPDAIDVELKKAQDK